MTVMGLFKFLALGLLVETRLPDRGPQMFDLPRHTALAAVSLFCLLPIPAHAGAGGTPTAPGAGKSTNYCCTTWERATPQGATDQTQGGQGKETKTIPFLNGIGCAAIAEDDFSMNGCLGTTAKCRGEFFTPRTGKVERCLTP
jgi:hypothetical protein